MIKLNLGAGVLPLKGYTNVDINKGFGIDVVHDVTKIKEKYKDNSVDEVFAKDLLEHIGAKEWKPTLQAWVDILKPGGVLKIRVPDTLKLFKQFEIRGHERKHFDNLIRLLFGLQNFPANTHLTGFAQSFFIEDLEEMGMKLIKTWYDGGCDLRTTTVKGDSKPLVDLKHPDYLWKELKIVPEGETLK